MSGMARMLTVTLKDDVAALVEKEAQRTGVPPEEVVSESVRRTLENDAASTVVERFAIRGPFLRARQGVTFEDIEGLLDEAEGPLRR
jgi:guanyl-specific ribonuclease Sa